MTLLQVPLVAVTLTLPPVAMMSSRWPEVLARSRMFRLVVALCVGLVVVRVTGLVVGSDGVAYGCHTHPE